MLTVLFVTFPYVALVIFEAIYERVYDKKMERKDKVIFRREIAKITRGITKPRLPTRKRPS